MFLEIQLKFNRNSIEIQLKLLKTKYDDFLTVE